jgi:proline dehydrogenase
MKAGMRSSLLYLSEQSWLRALDGDVARLAQADVALCGGANACRRRWRSDESWRRTRRSATLDCLGENVSSMEDAAASRDSYLAALAEIEATRLPATVSIKLTQFGLDLSPESAKPTCWLWRNGRRSMQSRVEVDMESSDYTDRTLTMVNRIQALFPGMCGL